MMRRFAMLAVVLGCVCGATAQPADDAAINTFVETHSVPAHLGRIARWEDPICPGLAGLPPKFGKFILDRIRAVATAAGTKVDPEGCKANISIVFTTTPQALLDNLRVKESMMLGYFDNSEQADKMAKVTHPIQAWYATKTVDLHGQWTVDSRVARSNVNYDARASTGTRIGDGLHSAFYIVTIVADPSKLVDHEIGSLADNIAMLALSQPGNVEDCSALPSIVNLSLTGCVSGSSLAAMSPYDSAFLYGLYHFSPGGTLRGQKDAITAGMKEKLAAK